MSIIKNKEDKEVSIIKMEISPIVAKAEALKVKDPKSMEAASLMLSQLNQKKDRVEEEKDKVLKPLNQARTAEINRWKPVLSVLESAIGLLRGSISDWQTEEVKRARKEEADIAARVGEGRGKFKVETAVAKVDEIERPDAKVVTKAGSVGFREDKILKIVDIESIPRAYLVPNEALILADLKAGKKVKGCELDIKMTPINSR